MALREMLRGPLISQSSPNRKAAQGDTETAPGPHLVSDFESVKLF